MAAVLDFSPIGFQPVAETLADLHTRYSGPLKRYFRNYRLNPADAEDLAQEVFVRLASLDACIVLRRPQAFIFTLASNLVRDRARRLHIRASSRSIGLQDLDLCCGMPNPEERLEIEQQLTRANRMLAALKPLARAAFVMHRVHGESYAAIAVRMKISVSMVEKHIMSAAHVLRSMQ